MASGNGKCMLWIWITQQQKKLPAYFIRKMHENNQKQRSPGSYFFLISLKLIHGVWMKQQYTFRIYIECVDNKYVSFVYLFKMLLLLPPLCCLRSVFLVFFYGFVKCSIEMIGRAFVLKSTPFARIAVSNSNCGFENDIAVTLQIYRVANRSIRKN